MVIIKQSNDANHFSLNDLDYPKGKYELYYNNVRYDSNQEIIESVIKVGIRSIYNVNEILQSPISLSNYSNDGVMRYSSLDTFIGDVSTLIADPAAGGGGGPDITPHVDEIETKLDTSNAQLTAISTNTTGLLANSTNTNTLLINIDNNTEDVKDEIVKLTSNNTYEQHRDVGVINTYSQYKRLTFTVYDGTADITINGNTETFPITGSNTVILGDIVEVDNESVTPITIDSTNGGVRITINR